MSEPSKLRESLAQATLNSGLPRKEDPTYATKTATFRLAVTVLSMPCDCGDGADSGDRLLMSVADCIFTEDAVAFEPAEQSVRGLVPLRAV